MNPANLDHLEVKAYIITKTNLYGNWNVDTFDIMVEGSGIRKKKSSPIKYYVIKKKRGQKSEFFPELMAGRFI